MVCSLFDEDLTDIDFNNRQSSIKAIGNDAVHLYAGSGQGMVSVSRFVDYDIECGYSFLV